MGRVESYRDLEVWQLAVEAVVECYSVTSRYPADERYALTRETRRSAVSVPSNIAEGHNRRTRNAYLNHVNIALGSMAELETQLEIAARLRYVTPTQIDVLQRELDRVGRMLRRLQQSLESQSRKAVLLAMAVLVGTALLAFGGP